MCDELESRKHLVMASGVRWRCLCFVNKMTELGQRWPTQAWLMRDEFSKHQCPGQERCRLLEAAEKTVSRSFLCLEFVVSQSVIVSRTACLFCDAVCVVCGVLV